MSAFPGSSKGSGGGDVPKESEKNEGAVGKGDGDEKTGRVDDRTTVRSGPLGAEGGGDLEQGYKVIYEFHEKMNELVLEFIVLVKTLPKGFERKFTNKELVNHLEVIGRIAYDRESEFLDMVRRDEDLAIKLWDFLVYSTATVLNSIIAKKNSLLSRPVSQTYKYLKDNEDAIRLAFSAISNFVGADIDVIPVEKYAEMIRTLGPIWLEGSFDEFGRLSYFPLENLVWKVERAEHFLNEEILSVADLVGRCRSYAFTSPQFAGLLAIILNLCQVPRANKDLLTMRLPGEEELLINHLLEGVKQESPIEVRIAVTGILKNMAFYPESHETILNRAYDILTYAIIPVHGTTCYVDQYGELFGTLKLNEEVDRDPSPDVRQNCVEFFYQLCALDSTRETLRKLELYPILREYSEAEVVPDLKKMVLRVINIMIQTEQEIGVPNLKDVPLTTPEKPNEDKKTPPPATTSAAKPSTPVPPPAAPAPPAAAPAPADPAAPAPADPAAAQKQSPEPKIVDDFDVDIIKSLFTDCILQHEEEAIDRRNVDAAVNK